MGRANSSSPRMLGLPFIIWTLLPIAGYAGGPGVLLPLPDWLYHQGSSSLALQLNDAFTRHCHQPDRAALGRRCEPQVIFLCNPLGTFAGHPLDTLCPAQVPEFKGLVPGPLAPS